MTTLAKEILSQYVIEDGAHPMGMGERTVYQFPNGYGASVITGSMFYTDGERPYELAVLVNGDLCYDTEITDDVIGHLDEIDVLGLLNRIKSLPVRENEDE